MLKYINLCLIMFAFVGAYSQSSDKKKNKDFVYVDVKGLKGFMLFSHSEPKNENKSRYRNRLKLVKKGKVKLKIRPKDHPVPVYTTSFRNLYNGFRKGSAGDANSITFYTEPGKDLRITGYVKDKVIFYQVDSSIHNYWYVKYRNMILPYIAEQEISSALAKKQLPNPSAIDSINLSFVQNHPNTLPSILILRSLAFKSDHERFMDHYAFIDPDSLQYIPFGKNVKMSYENIKRVNTLNIGDPAPDFMINYLDETKSLSDINQYVLLDFWGTWCSPCIKEMPSLSTFNKQYGDSIQVIGVAYKSNKPVWERLIKKYDLNYKHVFEGELIANKYGINVFPSKVLIDPDGILMMISSESISELEDEILDLIKI